VSDQDSELRPHLVRERAQSILRTTVAQARHQSFAPAAALAVGIATAEHAKDPLRAALGVFP
jgi:hypothetical protein